jgi:hypothetical protein
LEHQPGESKDADNGAHKDTQGRDKSHDKSGDKSHDNIPFWRVVLSVIQASFGVQNPANRERDFKQGSIMPFVVAAVLFTVLFVVTLLLVVNLVLG